MGSMLYSFPEDFVKGYKCHEKSHMIFKQVKEIKVKTEWSPELLSFQKPYIIFLCILMLNK